NRRLHRSCLLSLLIPQTGEGIPYPLPPVISGLLPRPQLRTPPCVDVRAPLLAGASALSEAVNVDGIRVGPTVRFHVPRSSNGSADCLHLNVPLRARKSLVDNLVSKMRVPPLVLTPVNRPVPLPSAHALPRVATAQGMI